MHPIDVYLKRLLFRHHVCILLVIVVLLIGYWCYASLDENNSTTTLTLSVGALTLLFGVQKQHIEETQFFAKLFKEFNCRYNALNDRLNDIVSNDERNDVLKPTERNALNDYFNLCSEEYLYYRRGYIDPEVWQAWRNGMTWFLRCNRIRMHWESEKSGGSYYGLETDLS